MKNSLPVLYDDTGTVLIVHVEEQQPRPKYVEEHPACAFDDTGTVSIKHVEEPLAHAWNPSKEVNSPRKVKCQETKVLKGDVVEFPRRAVNFGLRRVILCCSVS